MSLGVYIHIPYCKQICPYCDFTKYEMGKIMPPEMYISLLREEIRLKAPQLLAGAKERKISTVYFGGGTPSLLEPGLILSVIEELAKAGFSTTRNSGPDSRGPAAQDESAESPTEFTVEIDPGTADQAKLDSYLEMGVTRFSVGAQTFNDRLLKVAGRKHSSQDTVNLLSLLKKARVNYSFDLLFALPTQTLEELRADIVTALAFEPSHISAYCLTVPESHPMAKGRAPEEEQTEMFDLIESELAARGIQRYEISNFARPGFESKHNLRYWTDLPYWGLGVSSHSYLPRGYSAEIDARSPWGTRFWNGTTIKTYEKEIAEANGSKWSLLDHTPEPQLEVLEKHQALTDHCHTTLRLLRGLDTNALRLKFGEPTARLVIDRLEAMEKNDVVMKTAQGWTMTNRGRLIANSVFEKLTFLRGEI
jgi:oxygen-independent coproporphyrinogen III oxidase